MTALQDWDYPPYPFLRQVLQHCADSGKLYLDLWVLRDEEGMVEVPKADVVKIFLLHPAGFKKKLLALCVEGVCSMYETEDKYLLEFVRWDHEFDAM